MKWFDRSIPEAIQLSKQKGSLFIVYIYGTDELSEQMNTSWDAAEVSAYFDTSDTVALRISGSSEECKFFSQIYPVCVVPSTFCIGDGGIPLEVIGGHMAAAELVKKIQSVEQLHASRKEGAASSSQARETTPVQAASSSQSETPAVTSPSQPAGEQATGEQAMEVTEGRPLGDDTPEGAMAALPLEVRVQRAKELIEKKKTEKEKAEFEKQREEEVKRRKLGHGLSQLKKSQQEAEFKEVQDQLKKDKEEEKKAREKIRAQIAKDREERQAKFQKEKEEREAAMEESKRAKLQEQQRLAAQQEAQRSETARIQVRLPDGSSVSQSFPSTEPLQSLYTFVSQKMGCKVSLSTTFPRRRFTQADMSSSFADLELAPTAVIIALPETGSRSSGVMGSSAVMSGGLMSMLLYPFSLIWNFIMYLLGGLWGGNSPPSQSSQTRSHTQTDAPTDTRPARPATAYQRRTQGNMRRMTDMRDDDDDMSTYNGNSTQQL